MEPTVVRWIKSFLFLFASFAPTGVSASCSAQSTASIAVVPPIESATSPSGTVNLAKDHLPVMPLPALWRFHPGDDPDWADPKFDDSGWPLLRSDRDWYTQGFKGYSGMGWYRFRVVLPSHLQNASIILPDIYTSFEAFANGIHIGTFGKMPPHGDIYSNGFGTIIYTIPPVMETTSAYRTVIIAIRVWMWPSVAALRGGGPDYGVGLVGDTVEVTNQRDLVIAQSNWHSAGDEILAVLQLFAAFVSLTLFLLRRKEDEYLWFSLKNFCSAIAALIALSTITHVWNIRLFSGLTAGLSDATNLLYIIFFFKLLKARNSWFFKFAALCTLIHLIFFFQTAYFKDFIPFKIAVISQSILDLPPYIWIVFVILKAAVGTATSTSRRSRQIDARLLILPVLLQTLSDLYYQAQVVNQVLRLKLHFIDFTAPFIEEPFPLSAADLVPTLFLLSVFAILVIRFARTRSEQERFSSEIEGARSVQHFLISRDLPEVIGFKIESDYRPALEVGGDFFQVIANPEDRSALILVGDVAGKGMQAGMLATLLVGSMRTAATFTGDPAVILSTLNNRLYGKGIATCLALRVEVGGESTLINAGHLPPYLNGVELPMEGALPLGIISGIDFPALTFSIREGDTLTLISDGILEAQTPDGELFGFDRILMHLKHSLSASSLANAAQAFGQSDDITVLTLKRLSGMALGHEKVSLAPMGSIASGGLDSLVS